MQPIALVKTNGEYTHIRFAFISTDILTIKRFDPYFESTPSLLYPSYELLKSYFSDGKVEYADIAIQALSPVGGNIGAVFRGLTATGYSKIGVVTSDGDVLSDVPALIVCRSTTIVNLNFIPNGDELKAHFASLGAAFDSVASCAIRNYARCMDSSGQKYFIAVKPDGTLQLIPDMGTVPAGYANSDNAWHYADDYIAHDAYVNADSNVSLKDWHPSFSLYDFPELGSREKLEENANIYTLPFNLAGFNISEYGIKVTSDTELPDSPCWYCPEYLPNFVLGANKVVNYKPLYLPRQMLSATINAGYLLECDIKLPDTIGSLFLDGSINLFKTGEYRFPEIKCSEMLSYSGVGESYDFLSTTFSAQLIDYVNLDSVAFKDTYLLYFKDMLQLSITLSADPDNITPRFHTCYLEPKGNAMLTLSVIAQTVCFDATTKKLSSESNSSCAPAEVACLFIKPNFSVDYLYLSVCRVLYIDTDINCRRCIIDANSLHEPKLDLSLLHCEHLQMTLGYQGENCWDTDAQFSLSANASKDITLVFDSFYNNFKDNHNELAHLRIDLSDIHTPLLKLVANSDLASGNEVPIVDTYLPNDCDIICVPELFSNNTVHFDKGIKSLKIHMLNDISAIPEITVSVDSEETANIVSNAFNTAFSVDVFDTPIYTYPIKFLYV